MDPFTLSFKNGPLKKDENKKVMLLPKMITYLTVFHLISKSTDSINPKDMNGFTPLYDTTKESHLQK